MTLTSRAIGLLLLSVFLGGCYLPKYSFTGAEVDPELKTISIATFPSYASLAPPYLSQTFTESLKDIFIRQTSLTMIKSNGDISMEGEIVDYNVRDEAASASISSLSRLSITVKVRYYNSRNEQQNYEQTFTQSQVFDASQTLSSVEESLITQIVEQLCQDIFNKSFSNW